MEGILTATATGGVIFAYTGFEQAIQLAGESANPRRNIPMAVIGSILLGILLFIALQVAFLGSLSPSNLVDGWGEVQFTGLFGPFAGLATGLGLGWLAVLLYADAMVSPGGAGLLFSAASSRLSYGMARNGYIPDQFAKVNSQGVPVVGIIFSFCVGMIVFLPFPGSRSLVGFVTSAMVLAYAMAPLALGAWSY